MGLCRIEPFLGKLCLFGDLGFARVLVVAGMIKLGVLLVVVAYV